MAEVLLFHHAQGQTEGFMAFAAELRRAGHTVHTPDLFDGRTFGSIDEGMAQSDSSASARSSTAASGPRTILATSSSTPASRSASCRRRSSRRRAPAREGRCSSTPACRCPSSGRPGRPTCRCRSTGWTRTRSSSTRATSTPRGRSSSRPRTRALSLSRRPALLRGLEPAVLRRGCNGVADATRARLSPRLADHDGLVRRGAAPAEVDAHHHPAEGRVADLGESGGPKVLRLPTWSSGSQVISFPGSVIIG